MSHTENHASEHSLLPADRPPISGRLALVFVVALFIVAAVAATLGILPRISARKALAEATAEAAAPNVAVLVPKEGQPSDEVVLPGNLSAFTDSPIYARTNGYLQRWFFDIGAHVKKGDLLAIISTPEVDQQLAQAQSDLMTAQANASIARTTAKRYQDLLKSDSVTAQETETYTAQAAATDATVGAATANVKRLKELQSFERIYAPFNGVITARNVDVGTLITEGAQRELFHMQALDTLRCFVNVPQIYSQGTKVGMKPTLSLQEYPNRVFDGNLVRTSNAIDPASRTLLVEVDVNNRTGELLPGAYTQVHFKIKPSTNSFVVPVSALVFRKEGMQVVVLTAENRAKIVNVTIGQDDGRTVQIISGLEANSRVVQDPPDAVAEGQKLNPIQPQAKNEAK